MTKHTFVTNLIAFLLVGVVSPHLAAAATVPLTSLPAARIVEQTRTELLAKECVETAVADNALAADVPPGKPYRIAAIDRLPGTYFFCDPATVEQLTTRTGQVRADEDSTALTGVAAFLLKPVIQIMGGLIATAAKVGNWVMFIAFDMINYMLTPKSFVTHPMVTAGWPFILGIANLGFIIALLFIAFATTLNIDIGGGVKRTLPRLLAAAVLINFSLVIGGVIIDVSRIMMTIIAGALTQTSLEGIASNVAFWSGIGKALLVIGAGSVTGGLGSFAVADPNYQEIYDNLLAAALTWGLTLGFLVLAVSLFIRYVALILLLIVSPLAYLALAFPGASNIAGLWWKQFLKYVFYGPFALFILVLATRVGDFSKNLFGAGDSKLLPFVNLGVVIGLLMFGAFSGRYMGIALSGATAGFLTAKGRSVGRWAAGKGLRYSGAPAVGRQVKDVVSGVKGKVGERARTGGYGKVVKALMPPKRDKAGNLLPGQESMGSVLADKVMGITKQEQEQRDAARRQGADGARAVAAGNLPLAQRHYDKPALAPRMLRSANTLKGIGQPNLTIMMENTSKIEQVKAVARNKDYWRTLDDQGRTDLQAAIENNANLSPRDLADALKAIDDTLEALNKENK